MIERVMNVELTHDGLNVYEDRKGLTLPTGLPANHVCRCRSCEPSLDVPSPEPLSEGHIALRYGDDRPTPDRLRLLTERGVDTSGLYFLPSVNGQYVSHTVEVMPGRDGYVVKFAEPLHVCLTCGSDACTERRSGNVGWSIGRLPEDRNR